jgi:hypothetical protein
LSFLNLSELFIKKFAKNLYKKQILLFTYKKSF